MAGPRQSRTLRPRGPGAVLTALATVAVLLLGVIALDAAQAPPPTVAEFAPSALRQIQQAPSKQGSDVGSGATGGRGGSASRRTPPPKPGASPRPTPTPTPSVGPRANPNIPAQFTCVGNPPRQIQDPQSPPCVPYWTGNNGGSTSFGVTGNEIRVAAPYGTFLTGDPTPQYQAITKFFNTHFQFYGRQIKLVTYQATGDNFAYPDPQQMLADAAYVGDQAKAFAALGYPDRKGAEQTYYDELARRHVISVVGRDTATDTEAHLRAKSPYEWSRGTTIDNQELNYGTFVCRALKGGAPRYGGPAWPFAPQPTVRKFGILATQATDGTKPDLTPLLTTLAGCGISQSAGTLYTEVTPETQGNTSTADAANPVLQMVNNKVTSVMCFCDVGSDRDFMTAAAGENYYPEWLQGTYINGDVDNSFDPSHVPASEADKVIGISFLDKNLPLAQSWWAVAMREGDPSVPIPTASRPLEFYEDMLLLASGIQMAGPNLTPQNFADALHRTVFPNPGADAGPYFQSRVGFEGGTYDMRQHAGMYWYSQEQPSTYDPSSLGRVCWVYDGRRYGLDSWPAGEQPFQKTCA